MPAWLIWLIVAGLLAAAETLSLDFVLVMVAGGAAAGGVSAALGAPAVVQVVVAMFGSLGLLAFVRPLVRRHLTPPSHVTGVAALVGAQATVLAEVDEHGGRVRLNGQEWSARSLDAEVLPPGTKVRVLQIAGATAVVLRDSPTLS